MIGFTGLRYWPGRYVLVLNGAYWTGQLDRLGVPHASFNPHRARKFVSARHAYESARPIEALRDWHAKRVLQHVSWKTSSVAELAT